MQYCSVIRVVLIKLQPLRWAVIYWPGSTYVDAAAIICLGGKFPYIAVFHRILMGVAPPLGRSD